MLRVTVAVLEIVDMVAGAEGDVVEEEDRPGKNLVKREVMFNFLKDIFFLYSVFSLNRNNPRWRSQTPRGFLFILGGQRLASFIYLWPYY